MTRNLSLLLLVLFSTLSSGQNNLKNSIDVPEIDDDDIVINGVLDESQWAQGAKIQSLEQYFPIVAAQPPGVTSEVTLFYTQKGFYLAATFTDERAKILSQLTPRDIVNANTDWMQLIINPFNDGANDFNFYLSAAGVQGDSRATSDEDEDGSWNAVWYSAVVKEDHRWTAEVFIPYRVLRIPESDPGATPRPWGFNIKRSIRSDRTMYSWNPIDRNFDNESLQSGLLTGILVKDPPLRASLRPNITGTFL